MYEPFFCENTQFDNIKYDNTVLALLTIEGLGLTVGGLLILATFLYFCFIDKLKTTFIVIQSQICLTLFSSIFFIGLGFMLSPCQILDINNSDIFVPVCVVISATQLFAVLSSFSWKVIEALHICHLVARACYANMNIEEARSPALEKLAIQDRTRREKAASFKKVRKLERTFSADLETADSSRRLRKIKTKRESIRDTILKRREWYITLFSRTHPRTWVVMVAGYLPALVITGTSLATKNGVIVPDNSTFDDESILDEWRNVTGIDTFCWPGTRSGMIWYMAATVPLLIFFALFFRLKAIQMLRLLRGNPLKHIAGSKAMSSVAEWQQQFSGTSSTTLGSESSKSKTMEEFNLKPSSLTLFVMSCAWTLGILHSIFVWGLSMPFGVMCFLQGLIYFLMYVAKNHFSSIKSWMVFWR